MRLNKLEHKQGEAEAEAEAAAWAGQAGRMLSVQLGQRMPGWQKGLARNWVDMQEP